MPARGKNNEIADTDIITIGGIELSGADLKTIKGELRTMRNVEKNRYMSVRVYMSKVMEEMAANIRAGKRMKKY